MVTPEQLRNRTIQQIEDWIDARLSAGDDYIHLSRDEWDTCREEAINKYRKHWRVKEAAMPRCYIFTPKKETDTCVDWES